MTALVVPLAGHEIDAVEAIYFNDVALGARDGAAMAQAVADGLRTQFSVPQATLRLWDLAAEHDGSRIQYRFCCPRRRSGFEDRVVQ